MSHDGIGPHPTLEPSPYRLVPEFDHDLGYGEDYEPDQMLEDIAKSNLGQLERERIARFIERAMEVQDG